MRLNRTGDSMGWGSLALYPGSLYVGSGIGVGVTLSPHGDVKRLRPFWGMAYFAATHVVGGVEGAEEVGDEVAH